MQQGTGAGQRHGWAAFEAQREVRDGDSVQSREERREGKIWGWSRDSFGTSCVLQGGNSALSLAHGDIAALLRAHIELSPSVSV